MPYPVAAVRNKNFGSPQYSGLILSLGPIAYWPLNDASGSAALNQVSAALNGAYTACTLAQAQPPFTAPLWDGATSYCNIYSAGLNTAKAFLSEGSVSIWAKVSAAGVWTDGTTRYVINVSANTDLFQIARSTTNGSLFWRHTLNSTAKTVALASLSTTAWMHLAITWTDSGDAMIAYYNGAQTGATQTGLNTQTANNLLATSCNVGAATTVPSSVWSGWLAHTAIWNRPLTPTEVSNLYAWGVG